MFLIILGGLIIPQNSSASVFNFCESVKPGTFWYDYCHYYYQNFGYDISKDGVPPDLVDLGFNTLGAPILNVFTGFVYAIGIILVVFFSSISIMFSTLLTNIIAKDFGCFTCMANPPIALGWPMVRNLANMMIVLGFVVIGIATALRFKDYEAKKLLPKLIIVALLINFSLLICGIFIDGANIMSKSFTNSGFFSMSWSQTMKAQIQILSTQWKLKGALESAIGVMSAVAGLTVYNIMAIIIFALYFFLYLFRYISLLVLVILSPLAFACYVFPVTKKIYDMWWNNFFQWCIIIVPLSFFMWIANSIMSGVSSISSGAGGGAAGNLTPMSFLIPGIFMLIGFLFSLKFSAMGAGAAVSAFKWTGGKATAAGMGTLKGLSDKSGASRLGAGAKDMATRGLEYAGIMKPGTTAANQQSRLSDKERINRINSMTDEQKVQELTRNRTGHNAYLDRAQITKDLASKGKINLIPAAQRQQAINEAINFGARPKDIITGMESGDIANIINNPAANQQFTAEARAEGFKTLTKRKDLDLITGTPPVGATPAQRTAEATRARGVAVAEAVQNGARIEEIEKSDYHYAAQNQARRQRIQAANPTFNDAQVNDAALNQALDENISSMDHEQLRNIDADHLTWQRVDKLTPDKIGAFRYASQPARAAVKSHFDPTNPGAQLMNDMATAWAEYNAAVTSGNTAQATNRLTEFRRLRAMYHAQNNFSAL